MFSVQPTGCDWNIKIPVNVSKKKVMQRKGEMHQLASASEEVAMPGRKPSRQERSAQSGRG